MNKDNKDNIEDIYQLSPTQHGMLFHTLYAPHSGIYIEQRSCVLDGPLDVPAFEQAWRQVIDRHAVLRTSFIWDDISKPVQVVHRQVDLMLKREDWGGLSVADQQEQLQAFLLEERIRGFDLSQAPLMRLALFRLADNIHQFVWTNHHIVMDGWSRFLLLKEFFSIHDACWQARRLDLASPTPYRNYIAWLRRQELTEAERFWRQTLKGFTAPTPLVADRAFDDSDAQETEYREQEIVLSAATTAALQSLARHHQLTLNTLVQGAWALLLSRYSGEEDVVFGATCSGRPSDLKDVENTIGLFIVTLPVRVQLSPEVPLVPWLNQLQSYNHEMLQYEYTPLVQVQGCSEISRGQPLFESIVVFESYPVDNLSSRQSESFEIRDLRSTGNSNYPLALIAVPGTELSLRFGYHARRFDRGTIKRMLGHMKTLLESFLTQPEQRLSGIALLSQQELHQILVEWNDTARDYPDDHAIHELFEVQVKRTPEATAVIYEQEQISYQELNRRANQLGRYLIRRGVGPETVVAICMERGIDMVVALLGILKAGGAYLPLDAGYPKQRLEMMLADAGVKYILSQEELKGVVGDEGAEMIYVDRERESVEEESEEDPYNGVTPENLAYIIYTSGSTGKPKGALITHRSLCNLVDAEIRAFGVHEGNRVLQFASLSFDTSAAQIFMALNSGATLVIPGGNPLYSKSGLVQLLRDRAITTADIVPSVLEVLPPQDLPSLNTISTGAERCSKELVDRWAPGRVFFNVYGLTETTICTTLTRCSEKHRRDPPIGKPIANTRVYLLDRDMRPVPIGIHGELYVGGVCVGRGYVNCPDLTAERFIPDPFSRQPGARLYKTGDLGRYLFDGNIEFMGRSDDQVKIRGFRIEPAEIEAILKQYPAVEEAVVVAKTDAAGGKRLVAYVVARQNGTITAGDLRDFLRQSLPDFMVPSNYVTLDTLPMTVGGKVDRGSLPDPETSRPELDAPYEMPRTDAERTIAAFWQQVLEVEKVGLNDNFFDLGGHSLHLIQVHGKLREVYGEDITMMDLFNYPTVSSLAKRIAGGRVAGQSFQKTRERASVRKESMKARKQQRQKFRAARIK